MTEKMNKKENYHRCKKCDQEFRVSNWIDFGTYSQIEFGVEPVFFCNSCYKKIVQFEVSEYQKTINKLTKEDQLEAFTREFTQTIDIEQEVRFMNCVDLVWTAQEIINHFIQKYFVNHQQAYGYLEQMQVKGYLQGTNKEYQYKLVQI